jgi:hypothetical protein
VSTEDLAKLLIGFAYSQFELVSTRSSKRSIQYKHTRYRLHGITAGAQNGSQQGKLNRPRRIAATPLQKKGKKKKHAAYLFVLRGSLVENRKANEAI